MYLKFTFCTFGDTFVGLNKVNIAESLFYFPIYKKDAMWFISLKKKPSW